MERPSDEVAAEREKKKEHGDCYLLGALGSFSFLACATREVTKVREADETKTAREPRPTMDLAYTKIRISINSRADGSGDCALRQTRATRLKRTHPKLPGLKRALSTPKQKI